MPECRAASREFSGAPPPIETLADGSQRIGRIDMSKTSAYGPGDNDGYTLRVVGGAGEPFTYAIRDDSTGVATPFVPEKPTYSENRGNIVNTEA